MNGGLSAYNACRDGAQSRTARLDRVPNQRVVPVVLGDLDLHRVTYKESPTSTTSERALDQLDTEAEQSRGRDDVPAAASLTNG